MHAGYRTQLPGKLWLDSKPVPQRLSTADRIRMGMSLVPEDRKRTGIFRLVGASNLTIASLWRRLQRGLTISQKDEQAVVASTIGNLSIKVSSPEVEIQALSGGNQQKVVIGRSLLTNRKCCFWTNRHAGSTWGESRRVPHDGAAFKTWDRGLFHLRSERNHGGI
jgi:ABC-type sugar transport system ATPase subunit